HGGGILEMETVAASCRGHRRSNSYCRSFKTDCVEALAWARTETPACCRMLALVMFAVSWAKSASRIWLRDEVRFCEMLCRLEMVEVKRFWIAPRSPRIALTEVSAASIRLMASFALVTSLTLTVVSDPLMAVVPRLSFDAVAPAAEPLMVSASCEVTCNLLLASTDACRPLIPLPLIASASSCTP